MTNLGAAIEIPCYFRLRSDASNCSQNNMGSWEHGMAARKLDIARSPRGHFLIGEDPYEDNLKRKSIFFAMLLKLNFGVPGRWTIRTHTVISLQSAF